ncbi:hypothetical protein E4T56_gene16513 [Termitomyces sp. T112]|nr:hypothetical protein E4T56_gene16513 [Termitomyces sp. T112]
MVGLFIGAPKLRPSSRKPRQREDVSYSELTTTNNDPTQSLKAAPSVSQVTSVGALDTVNPSFGKASLADKVEERMVGGERLPNGINAESFDEPEHGWTTVSSEVQPELSFSTMATPDLDDMVDVLAQSVSDGFLEQQSQPPDVIMPPPPLDDTKESEISQLKAENKNLEERLLVALRELSDVDRRNRELEGENYSQEQEIVHLKAVTKVKEEELLNAQEAELRAIKEAAICRQQNHAVEAASKGYLKEMTDMKDELAMAKKEGDELKVCVKEATKQNLELEERSRRLLDEHLAKEKEFERIRGISSDTDSALKSALSGLDRARMEQQDTDTKLRESLMKNKTLADQNMRLRDDLAVAKKELTEMRANDVETKKILEIALADLKSASQEKATVEGRIAAQEPKIAEMEKEIQSLRRLAGEMVKKHTQADVLERKNRMLIDQLRRQSAELRQKYSFPDIPVPRSLTPIAKADLVASVLGLVNRLNSDIFQIAAHMSESLDFTFKSDAGSYDRKAAVERTSITMGRPLALLLHTLAQRSDAEFNPFPVQIGLQACLVDCSAKIIASWCPGHWDYADFIAAIYSRIVGTTPGLAARWRAITERQLKTSSDGAVQTEMEEYFLRNLVDALIVAGWRRSSENARTLVDTFRERIAQVAKLALRLNTMLSDDLEILIVHSNETFDEERMEDAYDVGSEEEYADVNQIVCTTEMGLKFSTEDNALLKPKVVLQAALTGETRYDD